MQNNLPLNTDSKFFFDRRLKTLALIAFLILIWIIIIQFLSNYIKSNVNQNWNDIYNEKTTQQSSIILQLYNTYQDNLNTLSENISSNQDIKKFVQRNDTKKLFEELLKYNFDNSYQAEIYNTRLELMAFKGRKLDSDIYSLQRSLNRKKFSVIKEIGFYTYLILYSPIYDQRDSSLITGVLLTAKLIDINYQINNKFFQNVGLLSDINKTLRFIPEIIPANTISGKIDFDSANLIENVETNLKGIDGSTVGILLFPKYSQMTHIHNIDMLAKGINSLLVFGITVVFFLIFLKFLFTVDSSLLKFILFVIFLSGIRFIWLEFNFPSKSIDWEIFSPGFYASKYGFGIARSIGELLVTSIFVLLISLYGIRLVVKRPAKTKFQNNAQGRVFYYLKSIFFISIFFLSIYLFGSVIQSIVFDSNLKFFDKTSIIPSAELLIIQFIILILTFSLFTVLSSIVILICKNSIEEFSRHKNFRKFSFLIFLPVILICNQILAPEFNNFNIDYINRILIILLSFSFGLYIGLKIFLTKSFNLFSIKNFSLIILFCIITIPGILLEKITSQETYFIELIGRKISEKEDDRIKFLLMTELSSISENKKHESSIRNKNNLTELAFSIWADSKFSEENFNTAVVVLDTNKKMLSNFIFNPQSLNSDSIVKYADNYFFKKQAAFKMRIDSISNEDSSYTEEMEEDDGEFGDESSFDDISSLYITDKILILKNDIDKYYLGIVPFENVDLKNTVFAKNHGYLLVAVNYEPRNFLVQSSMQLFKNYSKDNLFDKLISSPLITEYIGGEVISSTDKDLSKINTLSLEAFRESIKYKNDKSDWRYELINNERYRTFYILAASNDDSGTERIYSISSKRNDLTLTTFFYLKFILFIVSVYLLILAIISVILLIRLKRVSLNYREKLFASFFIVSVIPITLLAFYTRGFIKDKYDQNFQNQIISDLNLVSQGIKGTPLNLGSLDSLNNDTKGLLTRSLLQTDKNFNLFFKTKLISTTNEELYKSDLLDTRVNAEAYYNIIYLRKDFFSKTEGIGVYSFIVGYKPFFDFKNNIVGLVSSQSVYKQNEINEELTEILTFIFGIYIIVIIILLVFVNILTDRISKPILKLQIATEKISKGESNVELKINRKDEIGNLVESFNKMSKELESSKDKLKKAEREAAWRDIARRVAHEIKNPLTPMKLSIQHLDEVYNNGAKNNFPDVLKKTRNIIINEIDKLNRIATEFSDFAKLSGRNYEETDLNEVIGDVVSLYKLAPNIEFREDLDRTIDKIFADKQELNRIFQNLIKNAIQSIDNGGVVELKTYKEGEYVYAEVIDNGTGINPTIMDNLFEPNFSTKSTGMGLGLAITKKSLDEMKAEIYFSSEVDKGTKVKIRFNPMNLQDK